MAKVTIVSKGKFSLGSRFDSPQLKVGRNEIEEKLINQDAWYFKALVASGAIVVEKAPEPPPDKELAEVIITEEKIEVVDLTSKEEVVPISAEASPSLVVKPVDFTPKDGDEVVPDPKPVISPVKRFASTQKDKSKEVIPVEKEGKGPLKKLKRGK